MERSAARGRARRLTVVSDQIATLTPGLPYAIAANTAMGCNGEFSGRADSRGVLTRAYVFRFPRTSPRTPGPTPARALQPPSPSGG